MFWIWLIVPLLFWPAWLRVSCGKPLRHVGTLHFILYFVAIYAGAYDLYERLGSTNDRFLISVMAYPLVALTGVLAATVLMGTRLQVFSGRVPSAPVNPRERRWVRFTSIVLFGALGAYLFLLGDRIPMLTLLSEGRDAGAVARFVATKGYNETLGPIGPLVWTSRILLDYFGLFLLVYVYGKIKCGQSSRLRLFMLLVTMAILTLAFNERYPVVKLPLYLAVFIMFGIERPLIRFRTAARVALVFVLLVPAIGVVHAAATGGLEALRVMSDSPVSSFYANGWHVFLNRGLQGQVTGLYYIYDIVPRYSDFFWGRTLSNPHNILPYEAVNLPYLVFDWHSTSLEGVQGSDPSAFFGEVYANFGLAISIAAMFLMGMVMQFTNIRFVAAIRRYGSPYYLALFALTMLYIADYALGFITLYFDARLYLIILLFVGPRLRGAKSMAVDRGRRQPLAMADAAGPF